MALALGSLTDALITAVAQVPPDQKVSPRVQNLKRRVDCALRPGAHGRTDQFAVARQLDGLLEKFQVLNREELADALHGRLVELEDCRNSWQPEILSLLLQLSDRPALLSKLETLAKPVTVKAEPDSLSWSDFNAHGTAYSSEDIWEEVDFAADSSDDDYASVTSEVSLPKASPRTPSAPEQDYVISDEVFVSGEDEELIVSIQKAQFWKQGDPSPANRVKSDTSRIITELQVAREVIFMLQGLPTSIFWRLDNDVEVDRSYTLAHSSSEALASILHSFTEIGAKVDAVRRFTRFTQTIPYMQTFCRGLEARLLEFDAVLSQTQCRYLSPASTISLIQLLDDVRRHSIYLTHLSGLIVRMDQNSIEQPMLCLDLLYDTVCMLEAIGDDDASRVLATLFFSCFKTYTRSIQLWMETGQIDLLDRAFFVRMTRENGELRTLWHDWYMLDEGSQKQNIPRFLQFGAQRVFTIGKSMVFLRHLNALPDRSESETLDIIFDDIYPTKSSSSISLPFYALVESTFDRLVNVNNSVSAGLLRTELDEQCGLWTSLDALQHVYFGKDISMMGAIDSKIFELMDRGRSWDDKFLLTELTRSAFSAMSTIDPSRLVIRSEEPSSPSTQGQSRSVRILEKVSIDYVLPWPIANIITQDAIESYQRISVFLMQIRRAKYAIVRQRTRAARKQSPDDRHDTLVHALHHNFLWFLDFLYSHLTYLVIAAADHSLRSVLSQAEDVDSMIAAHQSYMLSLEDQCLLSKNLSPIHEAIINLLDLCVYFADLQAVHAFDTNASEDGLSDQDIGGRSNILHRKRTTEIDFDSDSDEDDDEYDHEQTLTISFRDSPYDYQMRNVKRQYDHLISFIADGVKGIARADGLPSWNILADRLEWRKA
ncbi:uncharacterized protein N7459_002504 [Penicillium hispanicum]|uniref:uncharacterized protein n=1 Tax=Penicillium hispanicum TaxID=1080232 RepID=UPI0025412C45|nr:uncharacterized protein N7459_002504 [Penicillium hispanicum]KAJ5586739.1 hypothetical protein N7459_002504 [Penicillium hispanicum]